MDDENSASRRGRPAVKSARVKSILRQWITAGKYRQGELIPTERELTREFQISRMTLRKVIDDLEAEGLIFRIHGKGTVVAYPAEFGAAVFDARQSIVFLMPRSLMETQHAFLRQVTQGMQSVLAQDPSLTMSFCCFEQGQRFSTFFKEHSRLVRAWGGLLTFAGYLDLDSLNLLTSLGIPVVAFAKPKDPAPRFSYVDVDNEAGGRMAMRHLLRQGWRKPLVFDYFERMHTAYARLDGIRQVLRKAGIEREERFFVNNPTHVEADSHDYAQDMIRSFLEEKDTIDSVFVHMESPTIGIYRGIQAKGLTIGRDIAVIHYNDFEWLEQALSPKPTAVRQPFVKVAAEATKLLIRQMQEAAPIVEAIIIQPELIIRESCGVREIECR